MSTVTIIAVVFFFIAIGVAAAIVLSIASNEENNTVVSLGTINKIQVSVSGNWKQYETAIREASDEVGRLFNDNIALPVIFTTSDGSNGSTVAAATMTDSSNIYGGGIIWIYTNFSGTPTSGYKEVLIHELLHVMGIGIHNKWTGAVLGGNLLEGGVFLNTLAQYATLVGGSPTTIPLGDSGHWSEEVFGDEMMTPYIENATDLKLSTLTGAALKDMGWDTQLTKPPYEDYALPS